MKTRDARILKVGKLGNYHGLFKPGEVYKVTGDTMSCVARVVTITLSEDGSQSARLTVLSGREEFVNGKGKLRTRKPGPILKISSEERGLLIQEVVPPTPKLDLDKVKAAAERHKLLPSQTSAAKLALDRRRALAAAKLLNIKPEETPRTVSPPVSGPPADASLRKHVKQIRRGCSGFGHPTFLNDSQS
jgi:hypothetical protein